MKRRQKAGFLGSISSKITLTKEKEKRKKRERGGRKEEREKSNGRTPIFYNRYVGDSFWPAKNCWTEKVHLAVTFSKIQLVVETRVS